MMTASQTTPRDFVFMGMRATTAKDKLAAKIGLLNPDGSIGETQVYEAKILKYRVVGGIYTGAEFSAGQAKGLTSALYKGKFTDRTQLLEWEALDAEASLSLRSVKMEQDAKRVSEMQQILLPLRKLYDGYLKRFDVEGCEALQKAVLKALKTPVRKDEE